MFNAIVKFSVKRRLFVGLTTIFLLLGGIYAMLTLPVDAVPDITNNQVQIVTVSPTLAPQEVEQLITFPIEVSMSNIMNVSQIRSVSRFGLSVVTVVFEEHVPSLQARQLVNEQLQTVSGEIPSHLGSPELMPITTGLGEIYQYTLRVDPAYRDRYDAMELRTIQDWIVKRQLSGIPGIVEINSFGGFLKQYEVAVDPSTLYSLNITLSQVFEALNRNNENTGGSYIEKIDRAYYIRSEGMIRSLEDIEKIVVDNRNGGPVHISDVAQVRFGAPKRFGAMTKDGEGECVGGIAMMLKGANANEVTKELEKRVEKVQKMLPEGVSIEPYLNRSALVNRNISTVVWNLLEGALIVFVVLIIFLGDFRAGVIVASVIPLAMLFAFILMRVFNVSANLMSLGAIDFGIVVDGSIVIVEGILAHLYSKKNLGRSFTPDQMADQVVEGAGRVVKSATFAVMIILIVFFPILTLTGIEGKYFTPMAQTLVFCIVGALLLSLTYVPMMASLFLRRRVEPRRTPGDRFFEWLEGVYKRSLRFCMHHKWKTIGVAFLLLAVSLFTFTRLGAEFIPTLDEGDFAMQMTLPAGSSLSQSIELSNQAEKRLMNRFPEIKHVVAKIGTAEVPTDPMAVEDADIMIVMRPFKEWTSAESRAEMVELMKKELEPLTGAEFNFSQPIQLRFNELMTGAKADIAVKLYGEDMDELYRKAKEVAALIENIPGASDVLVEQAMGLPQLIVKYNRDKIAQYGINIKELNDVIRTAYAGERAGVVFENERRFDLVVRLDEEMVADLNIHRLFVHTPDGAQIPVSEVASVEYVKGPLQINRDATKRRIVIGVNVRNADIQQVVGAIQEKIDASVQLKPGYYFEYGGQFENLQNAIDTLLVVIPIALMLILLLLFINFKSITYTLLVFSTVPLSLIGGIFALALRGMPFSISAGVGFIALFGVAVLNGILMINHFNDYRKSSPRQRSTNRVIEEGCAHLLRPVFLTGLVASLGFVPMAIATSAGAEVQRPLATVVIGGLLVSTILTLIIIPLFYRLVGETSTWGRNRRLKRLFPFLSIGVLLLGVSIPVQAQPIRTLSADEIVNLAVERSPRLKSNRLKTDKYRVSRGEIVEIAPTEFSYAWGQLNSEIREDRQVSVYQSFGSLLTPFYKNKLVNTQITVSEVQRKLIHREVAAEAKRAWQDYLLAYNQLKLYNELSDHTDRLQQAIQAQFDQGEITLLERSMHATLAANFRKQIFETQQAMIGASRRLQWVCLSDTVIQPDRFDLSALPIPEKELRPSLQEQFLNAGLKVKEAEKEVEASRLFPEIGIGYSNQNILPLRNLHSWSVGVSLPIYFVPNNSRIKQARIEKTIAAIENDAQLRAYRNQIESLRLRLEQCRQTLDFYNRNALKEAEALIATAQKEAKHRSTNIIQFIQSINAAIEIKKGYNQALYDYNVTVIELELFAGQ